MGSVIHKEIGEHSLEVKVESGFPWKGNVTIQVEASSPVESTLALRIPDWCDKYTISELQEDETVIKDGYLYITKTWSGQEEIHLDFSMESKIVHANKKVRENIGKVAIVRGPIVYCLESIDNGEDLQLIRIDEMDCKIDEVMGQIGDEAVVKLTMPGERAIISNENESLYNTNEIEYEKVMLTLIPYYTWANRGEDEMMVWIRQK